MSEPMWTPGRVVWRELMTKDVEASKAFYGAMFGWTFQEMPMGPDQPPYTLAQVGDRQVGGITPAGDAPVCFWLSYVSTEDVDGAVAAATAAGGSAMFGPFDVPEVGRLAGILDFEGACIGLLRATTGDSPPAPPTGPEFCWETLSSGDVERAKAFYSAVFGWQTSDGPGGHGFVFGVGPGFENAVADVQPAEGMPPSWITYVVTEDSAASAGKAAALGGTVIATNIVVPSVGVIAIVQDPAGAFLGLFQPTMS